MFRIFSRSFVCEDGHITVGDTKKTKCDAKEWNLEYTKSKRKKEWIASKTEAGICGKKIISEKEVPEVMDFTKVWDYDVMHAFLMGQKFDSAFMIALQEQFCKILEKIDGKK